MRQVSMDSVWKILLVDDDEDDYILTREMLSNAHAARCTLEWAKSYHEGQAALFGSKYYDAVLMDYDLGEGTGIELIREATRAGYPSPFVLLTGRGSYMVDMEAMAAGASLYLTKNEVNSMLLERSIRYAIERRLIETQLLASNERLEAELGERRRAESALGKIEWLLTKNIHSSVHNQEVPLMASYGDLTELNKDGLLLGTAGKDMLQELVSDFLDLLDTSSTVYEKNGDYALGVRASAWCRRLDEASRQLYPGEDNAGALQSGQWLCHESCWKKASLPTIESGLPVDIECEGGIRIYARPVLANGQAIGSINFGYGEPPRDIEKLNEISGKFKIPVDELQQLARAYETRPPYLIDLARKRLAAAARLLGTIVERKQAEIARVQAAEQLEKSEGRFRRLFESDVIGFAFSNKYGDFLGGNDAFLNIIGYSREEFEKTGLRWDSLTPSEYLERDMQGITETSVRGSCTPYEKAYIRKDGSQVPVLVGYTLVEGSDDEYIAFILDLTKAKQAEQALRESETRERERAIELQMVMDAAPAYIWISRDRECRSMVGNKATYNLIGVKSGLNVSMTSPKNEIPRTFRPYRGDDELDPTKLPMQIAAATGEPVSRAEFELLFEDGQRVHVAGNTTPLFDQEGKPAGAVGVFIDITDRVLAERALSEQNEQLQEFANKLKRSNEALEEFAFIASHDLQEPLRKIIAFSSYLRKQAESVLGTEELNYLQRIQKAAGRMQTMVEGLLSLSRVTSDAMPFTSVDLNGTAREVVSDLEARLKSTVGVIHIGDLPVIEADPVQMRQLLQNLIGNALKFNRPSEPPVINVYASCPAGGRIEISVSDQGIGISEEDLPKLFQPFRRLKQRREVEGAGMGLAICRKIVERHKGSIRASSRINEGTTFTVELPVSQRPENTPHP